MVRSSRARVAAWVVCALALVAAVILLVVPMTVEFPVPGLAPDQVTCTPVVGTDPGYRSGVRDTGGVGQSEATGGCAAARDRNLGIALLLVVVAGASALIGSTRSRRTAEGASYTDVRN